MSKVYAKMLQEFQGILAEENKNSIFPDFVSLQILNFTLIIWQFSKVLFDFECSLLVLHFRVLPLHQKQRGKIACDKFDNSVIFFP